MTDTAQKTTAAPTLAELLAGVAGLEGSARKLRRWRDSANLYIETRSEADPQGAADARAEVAECEVAIRSVAASLKDAWDRIEIARFGDSPTVAAQPARRELEDL